MKYVFILLLSILGIECIAQDKGSNASISRDTFISNSTPMDPADNNGIQVSNSGYLLSGTTGSLKRDGEKEKSDYDLNGNLFWVMISLFLLNLAFSVFILFRINKKNINMDINELNEKFNNHCLEMENKINELRTEITKNRSYIDQKIEELIRKFGNTIQNNVASIPLEIEQKHLIREIRYAYSSVDGYFVDLMNDRSNAIAYFKLELEKDDGKYMIIDNDNPEMQKQMVTDGYPNIAPCVEEQNSRNDWKIGIETVDVGKVTKDERGWKISKKTVIRYK